MWVKYCGIRCIEDAEFAIQLGVDAIGVVVVPSSPRCAVRRELRSISRIRRGQAKLVLVTQDQARDDVVECLELLEPDLIQFHGNENREFSESFELPYIKATKDPVNLEYLREHRSAFAHLVDSEVFVASEIRDLPRLIIAGGLTCENVAERISMHKPWGVDVSRGIERSPGVKDQTLMRHFLQAVRGALR
ncbi:phosphoribosylanthranilate isomerase [bacterium]|nr:phosphoribosylanthranilate isomerase [bacterium]